MTTDPVQEARARVWREYQRLRMDGYSVAGEEAHDAALDAYAAAIRREEAARVLPVLWSTYQPALEFRCEDDSYGWHCTTCGVGILDAHEEWCAYGPVAAEITRLEALAGRLCPRCGGAGTTIEGSPVSAQWPEPCPECNGTVSAEALVKEGEDD